MTQSQHTPGPWIVQGDTYVTVNSLIIAHCKQAGNTTLEEAQANARLIAAAPELLEALEDLIGYAEHRFGDNDYYKNHGCMNKARAAIAKARGE